MDNHVKYDGLWYPLQKGNGEVIGFTWGKDKSRPLLKFKNSKYCFWIEPSNVSKSVLRTLKNVQKGDTLEFSFVITKIGEKFTHACIISILNKTTKDDRLVTYERI